MRNKTKKLFASLTAVTVAMSAAMSASALGDSTYTFTKDDVKDAELIKTIYAVKPYMNITLDAGDIDTAGMTFTLKRGDTVIGTFDGEMNFTLDEGADCYDITGVETESELYERTNQYFSRKLRMNDLPDDMPVAVFPDRGRNFNLSAEELVEWTIEPEYELYLAYLDENSYEIVDRMTVEPGTMILDVSSAYANRGDTTTYVQVVERGNSDNRLTPSYRLSENEGVQKIELPTGVYPLWLNGGNAGNRNIFITEESKNYVKLRIRATAMGETRVNPDNWTYNGRPENEERDEYPLGNAVEVDGGLKYMGYAFYSGSVVTADIPDEDGYLEIWALEDDPHIGFQTDYKWAGHSAPGGSTGSAIRLPFTYKKMVVEAPEFPKDGITLYDVASGEYTVELSTAAPAQRSSTTEYVLENNTLTVTETDQPQVMALTLSKRDAEPEPEPTDPEPTDPEPTEPEPTDPKPTEPDPTEPEPTEPTPKPDDSTPPVTGASSMLLLIAAATGAVAVTARRKYK